MSAQNSGKEACLQHALCHALSKNCLLGEFLIQMDGIVFARNPRKILDQFSGNSKTLFICLTDGQLFYGQTLSKAFPSVCFHFFGFLWLGKS